MEQNYRTRKKTERTNIKLVNDQRESTEQKSIVMFNISVLYRPVNRKEDERRKKKRKKARKKEKRKKNNCRAVTTITTSVTYTSKRRGQEEIQE